VKKIFSRIIHEPLFHFLLAGMVLFIVYQLWGQRVGEDMAPQKIVVTEGRVQNLQDTFNRRWKHPPTEEELLDLIHSYIREEVLYREAKRLGLDRDDSIIRRRLRQKIEFLSQDIATLPVPTDEELNHFLVEHADRYRMESRYSFSQVYLAPNTSRKPLEADIKHLLNVLNEGEAVPNLALLGDMLGLPSRIEDKTGDEVARLFGQPFTAELDKLATGRWQGPVYSGFGVHLILLENRDPGRLLSLEEAREQVVGAWAIDQRERANEEWYESLLARYDIKIQHIVPPDSSDGGIEGHQ